METVAVMFALIEALLVLSPEVRACDPSAIQSCAPQGFDMGEVDQSRIPEMCNKVAGIKDCLQKELNKCKGNQHASMIDQAMQAMEQQIAAVCSGKCSVVELQKCSTKAKDLKTVDAAEACKSMKDTLMCLKSLQPHCSGEMATMVSTSITKMESSKEQCAQHEDVKTTTPRNGSTKAAASVFSFLMAAILIAKTGIFRGLHA